MGVYLLLRKYARSVWGFLYHFTNNSDIARKLNKTGRFQKHAARKLFAHLEEVSPDIIVCTYFGIAQIISSYLRKHKIPTYTVLTDYHAHALSYIDHVSGYFVATQQMKHDLISYGAQADRIHVTGIPIDTEFQKQYKIDELKILHGLPKKKKVVLFIANMFTKKQIVTILAALSRVDDLSVFVAGTKQNFSIENLRIDVQTVGWTNNIHEYIALADIVITKSGGLTVTECIAQQKPIIIPLPFPGQEYENALYVQNQGFGAICTDIKKIDTLVQTYLSSQQVFPERNIFGSDASARIYNILLQ